MKKVIEKNGVSLRVENGEEPDTRKVTVEFTLDTDMEAIKKASLGKKAQTCKICGTSGDFQTFTGVEMFYGTGEEFNYFICPECETLQIEKIPEDAGKYYPDNYYSYAQPQINPRRPGEGRDSRMILDVGCGAGDWLCGLAERGFVNLYGCDPFIEKDIKYPNGVKIKKCAVHEMEGKYDIISLRSSFEHMPDPREVFKSLDRLLKRGTGASGDPPKIEIYIPAFPNLAFDIYGPFWYQMDPPRHFFMYSRKSIEMLAEQNGFEIAEGLALGAPGQFAVSRGYQLGIPFKDFKNTPRISQWLEDPMYNALSVASKAAQISDEAAFTLVRKGTE